MSTTSRWRNGRLVYYDTARPWAEVWPAFPGTWIRDDFLGVAGTNVAAATNWNYALDGGAATLETVTGAHGVVKILCSATEDDSASIAGPVLCWQASRNPVMEVRLAIESATLCGCFVGFNDAIGMAAGETAIFRTHGGAGWTTNSADAVGLVYDPHYATDLYIHGMSVKNGTDATAPVDTGVAFVANTFRTLRVELVDDGSTTTAYFYVDGVLYGSLADCITRTDPVTPMVAVFCREANDKYVYVDYIECYEKVV